MIISFIGIWCVRVPIALVCGKLLHLDVTFIWMAIALDQIVRILINMTVFHKKKVLEVVADGRAAKAAS